MNKIQKFLSVVFFIAIFVVLIYLIQNYGIEPLRNKIDKKLLNEIKSDIKNCLKEKGNPDYLSIINPFKKDFKSFKNLQTKIVKGKTCRTKSKKERGEISGREEIKER